MTHVGSGASGANTVSSFLGAKQNNSLCFAGKECEAKITDLGTIENISNFNSFTDHSAANRYILIHKKYTYAQSADARD
jgi:hypothetical protein